MKYATRQELEKHGDCSHNSCHWGTALACPIVQNLGGSPVASCPKCGSDDYGKRHHEGNFLAPECHWHECNDCGHKTEPS